MAQSKRLDFSSFEKAIQELKNHLAYYHSELAERDPKLKRALMAAVIQAYEFTYELSVKFLRRFLEISEPSAEIIEEMSFPNLIRTASERGLLQSDWSVWKEYRSMRNITSHTYDQAKAQQVLEIVPRFLEESEFLLNMLQERTKTL